MSDIEKGLWSKVYLTSRTHLQIDQLLKEVQTYHDRLLPSQASRASIPIHVVKSCSTGSRKRLCINLDVNKDTHSASKVDYLCKALKQSTRKSEPTATSDKKPSAAVKGCPYYKPSNQNPHLQTQPSEEDDAYTVFADTLYAVSDVSKTFNPALVDMKLKLSEMYLEQRDRVLDPERYLTLNDQLTLTPETGSTPLDTATTLCLSADLEDMVLLGKALGVCPYYANKYTVQKQAGVVCAPYNTILDHSIITAADKSSTRPTEKIFFVDEGHNFVNAMSEHYASSLTLSQTAFIIKILDDYHMQFCDRRDVLQRNAHTFSSSHLTNKVQLINELDHHLNLLVKIVRALHSHMSSLLLSCKTNVNSQSMASFVYETELADINFFRLERYFCKTNMMGRLTKHAERVAKIGNAVPLDFVANQHAFYRLFKFLEGINRRTGDAVLCKDIQPEKNQVVLHIVILNSGKYFIDDMLKHENTETANSSKIILLSGSLKPFDSTISSIIDHSPAPTNKIALRPIKYTKFSEKFPFCSDKSNIQDIHLPSKQKEEDKDDEDDDDDFYNRFLESISTKKPKIESLHGLLLPKFSTEPAYRLKIFDCKHLIRPENIFVASPMFGPMNAIKHAQHILRTVDGPFGSKAHAQPEPSLMRWDFGYETRHNPHQLLGLAYLLYSLSEALDDKRGSNSNPSHNFGGVVVFFGSYEFMDHVINFLRTTTVEVAHESHFCFNSENSVRISLFDLLETKKRLLYESKTKKPSQLWAEYKNLIADPTNSGKSACANGVFLFAVTGGNFNEGLDLADQYCRLVIMVGAPYPNKHGNKQLSEKMRYLDKVSCEKTMVSTCKNACGKLYAFDQSAFKGTDYYTSICANSINQCVGRAIRHLRDYSGILLLDYRYAQHHGSILSKDNEVLFNQNSLLNSLSTLVKANIQFPSSVENLIHGLSSFFA